MRRSLSLWSCGALLWINFESLDTIEIGLVKLLSDLSRGALTLLL